MTKIFHSGFLFSARLPLRTAGRPAFVKKDIIDEVLRNEQPLSSEDCSGVEYNFAVKKNDGPINMVHGDYFIDGLFLVTPIAGMHQGKSETTMILKSEPRRPTADFP
jgi:hypothetical protein